MIDPKFIRSRPDVVMAGLVNRGLEVAPAEDFLNLDEEWRGLTGQIDGLKAKRNSASDKIAELKRKKADASKILSEMKMVQDVFHVEL